MGYSGYPPQGILGTAASIHSGAAFPPTPAEGDCFYRTDLNEFFIWNGTEWVSWDVIPPTYIIYTDGTTIWTKNGLTGNIDFAGADALTVIQATINAVPGGKIFIKAGTYYIPWTSYIDINAKNNLIIEGEGDATIIRDTDTPPGQAVGGNPIFYIRGGSSRVKLRDMYLHGPPSADHYAFSNLGIKVESSTNIELDNLTFAYMLGGVNFCSPTRGCVIKRCNNDIEVFVLCNASLWAGGGGVNEDLLITENYGESKDSYIELSHVRKCVVSNNVGSSDKQFLDVNVSTGLTVESVLVKGNSFEGKEHWAWLHNIASDNFGDIKHLTIKGNIMHGVSTDSAIYIQNIWSIFEDVVIEGNTIEGVSGAAGNRCGIEAIDLIGVDLIGLKLANNIIHDCDGAGINMVRLDYTKISDNIIYNVGKDAGIAAVLRSGIHMISAVVAVFSEHNEVNDNIIYDDQGVPTTQYGIMFQDRVRYTDVTNNRIEGVVNQGIRTINSCDHNLIELNDVRGCGATIAVVGTSTIIRNNTGYNPQGNLVNPYSVGAGPLDDAAKVQAFPSNNTDYTVAHSPKFITIYDGTVTSISIDGVVTGLTAGSFYLIPGQVFNVVWTAQPSSQVYRV